MERSPKRLGDALAVAVGAILLLSGVAPYDRLTWIMEVFWVFLALGLYLAFFRRTGATSLLLWLLAAHCLILIAGGYWTYERVPLGNWLRDFLHLQRNNYDRIGHLAQGFVPAILFREIMLRSGTMKKGVLSGVAVLMMCLGFSAFFELIEWWSALALHEKADAFLATQGDPWDTQWDMFCCMIGASVSLLLLSGVHNRQLKSFRID